MVVKLTQKQAEFLSTFGDFEDEENKKRAIYHITRFGWGYNLTDGDDLNFSYVDSVFTCVNKSKKEPDSELVEKVKAETPIEITKESAHAFLDLAKEQGKVIEND